MDLETLSIANDLERGISAIKNKRSHLLSLRAIKVINVEDGDEIVRFRDDRRNTAPLAVSDKPDNYEDFCSRLDSLEVTVASSLVKLWEQRLGELQAKLEQEFKDL